MASPFHNDNSRLLFGQSTNQIMQSPRKTFGTGSSPPDYAALAGKMYGFGSFARDEEESTLNTYRGSKSPRSIFGQDTKPSQDNRQSFWSGCGNSNTSARPSPHLMPVEAAKTLAEIDAELDLDLKKTNLAKISSNFAPPDTPTQQSPKDQESTAPEALDPSSPTLSTKLSTQTTRQYETLLKEVKDRESYWKRSQQEHENEAFRIDGVAHNLKRDQRETDTQIQTLTSDKKQIEYQLNLKQYRAEELQNDITATRAKFVKELQFRDDAAAEVSKLIGETKAIEEKIRVEEEERKFLNKLVDPDIRELVRRRGWVSGADQPRSEDAASIWLPSASEGDESSEAENTPSETDRSSFTGRTLDLDRD